MMKKKTIIAVVFFSLACFSQLFSQTDNTYLTTGSDYIVTAGGSYLIPIGGLSDRLKSTIGVYLGFGKQVSEKWEWIGKLEYFKFTKVNEEKLFIKRKITINNVEKQYTIPIPKLKMDLIIGGVSANANVKFVNYDYLQSNLTFGFGVYNWQSLRGAYYDSVYVTDESGNQVFAEYLNVPEKVQMDWSGGINIGVNADVNLYGPLWFNAGANYKIVIGELWATLKLDLENISGFQMGEIYSGFKVKF